LSEKRSGSPSSEDPTEPRRQSYEYSHVQANGSRRALGTQSAALRDDSLATLHHYHEGEERLQFEERLLRARSSASK
jgi:hypothetical protein